LADSQRTPDEALAGLRFTASPVKELVARDAFVGVHLKRFDRLPQQLRDGLPTHFVSLVKGVEIDHFPGVTPRRDLRPGWLRLVSGLRDHIVALR